jgi:hypothetical protein
MPFVASSALGEYRLKSSANVPAAPVVIVSTPVGAVDELLVLGLLPQPASTPAVTSAATAAIVRTRHGLVGIDQFLLSVALGWHSYRMEEAVM